MIYLKKEPGIPLYISLYEILKNEIESERMVANEKLPSKRELASKLNISIVTVQNTYYQLLSEGYIYSIERSGFFVTELASSKSSNRPKREEIAISKEKPPRYLTFYENTINTDYFPFSTWAKLMRQTLSANYETLLQRSDNIGVFELRLAISDYLYRERNITVSPKNIVVGAGTEYLYSIIIKLLGRENSYGVESPGYPQIWKTYQAENVSLEHIALDEMGISLSKIEETQTNILHISPNHQFPTGIVMPYSRRKELLNWASENSCRYIIEDDYDSEFRFATKPISSIYSIDNLGKVIYINTFSKTIAPSLRISYMLLPDELLEKYKEKFNFISNTVPSFEQFVLAKFISQKYFERYIRKAKKIYKSKRDEIISLIMNSKLRRHVLINEQDAGLHFALTLKTSKTDTELKKTAQKQGVDLIFMSDFMQNDYNKNTATLIVSYTNFKRNEIIQILNILVDII